MRRRKGGLRPSSLTDVLGARRNPNEVVHAAASRSGLRSDKRRAGGGSSEDDLPLRLDHAQNRGVERGLNSTPDERGPAAGQYGPALSCRAMERPLLPRAQQSRPARRSLRRRRWTDALRRRPALETELAQRERRVLEPELGDLPEAGRRASSTPRRRAPTPTCSCAARLARTRLAWSAFARRFARARVAAMTPCSSSARTTSLAPASASTSTIVSAPFAYAIA